MKLTQSAFRTAVFLVFLAVAGLLQAAPAYPVMKGASGRYLVDQNNLPFLMVGDSPQSLVTNLSLSDAEYYLADRNGLGFNTVLVDVLVYPYTGGNSNGSLLNGTLPFNGTISTGEYDLTTPNQAYFEWVDRIVNLAAQQGICVMLDPCETGGWLQTMLDNGSASCRAYGQFLGNRYKNFPNIIWSSGNDFDSWQNPAADAVVTAVALGIKDFDSNHLHTVELNLEYSSSLDDPNWSPIVGLNAAYTYFPTYAEVLHAYNQSGTTPVFLIEAHYEFEDLVGDLGTANVLRRQEYWTLLSGGAAGQLYGNHYTWPFLTGWQAYLDSPGAIEMGYFEALFELHAWYNLVPDQTQSVVTAGYGSFSSSGTVSGNDYVTAASTPDGTLVMAYMPTVRGITVNMATLSGPATARWFDPTDGVFTAIPGSPFANSGAAVFTPPGNNSAGDGDWVLLLEYTPTRLVNLSARATSGTGSNALSAGFVVSGGTKSILVRGIGPGLIAFGVPGTLADPQLSVYSSGSVIYSNAGWGGTPALQAAFAQTGAFPLAPTSTDAALIDFFSPGLYTGVVTGANNATGVALIELYDADTSATPAGRLVNISARAQVGTGANVLIAGFVVSGNAPKTVLIRAIGPGLSQFGVTGVLANPQLDLCQGTTDLQENIGWGGGYVLSAAFAETGAFALDAASADSAMVITLPPGSYTAIVSGVNNTTGVALAEVYELP